MQISVLMNLPEELIILPDTLEESSTAGEKFQENTKDLSEKARESVSTMSQPASGTKGKMQRAQESQASGPSSRSVSPFNSTNSLDDLGSSTGLPTFDVAFFQLHSIQNILNQMRLICAVHRCYVVIVCIIKTYYLLVVNKLFASIMHGKRFKFP